MALLGVTVTRSEVDRIHQRSAGYPLFVEELARSADNASLTGPLANLFDRRFAGISLDEWVIARALGIADRPPDRCPTAHTDRTHAARMTAGLRALDGRHLTRTDGHDVRLRHPLLAEAYADYSSPARRPTSTAGSRSPSRRGRTPRADPA